MKKITVFITCLMIVRVVSAASFFVDQSNPNASDENPGTEEKPFKTLAKAAEFAKAGDSVLIKKGIYRESLMPKNSGTKEAPIVFRNFQNDKVVVSGSMEVEDFVKEGALWVKKPWIKNKFYWIDSFSGNAEVNYPFRASARGEQVFVNGKRLYWAPSRKDLKPGYFYWDKGVELVVCPLANVEDLNKALVEVPVRSQLLSAWQGDPMGMTQLRKLRKEKPDSGWLRKFKGNFPNINHIHVKGLTFRHAAHTVCRAGVRLDGDYWKLENCIVEWMNNIGVRTSGDYNLVKNCLIRYNGESGIDAKGKNSRFEDIISLYNNKKMFRLSWAGAGNKLTWTPGTVIKNMVSAFSYGSPCWFDIDCYDVVVENCTVFGNRPTNGSYFWEISFNAIFKNNVSFADHGNGSFYRGANLVISESSGVTAEDNVLLGGQGGVMVGGCRKKKENYHNFNFRDKGDHHISINNTVKDNIFFNPAKYTISIWDRFEKINKSSAKSSNNRFDDNVFVSLTGSPLVNLAGRFVENPNDFQKVYENANGNRYYDKMDLMGAKTRNRVNQAFSRVLNGLGRALPELKLPVYQNVDLLRVFKVGNPIANDVVAYLLKTNQGNLILMDVINVKGSEFEILCFEDDAPTELLDFVPLDKPLVRKILKKGNSLTGQLKGPMVLVKNVNLTYSRSDFINVKTFVDGLETNSVSSDANVTVNISVRNPLKEDLKGVLAGAGLDEAVPLNLKPDDSKSFKVSLKASSENEALHYYFISDKNWRISQNVNLKISEMPKIPFIAGLEMENLDETLKKKGCVLKIDRDEQCNKEVYDLISGDRWDGPKDLSGDIYLGWNKKGLFMLSVVNDKSLIHINEKRPFAGDCIELFLDGRIKDFNQNFYSKGAKQIFIVAPQNKEWSNISRAEKLVESEGRLSENGYVVKTFVPWSFFPGFKCEKGKILGFDIALDDADLHKKRKAQLIWNGNGNNYKDPSLFGIIKLD